MSCFIGSSSKALLARGSSEGGENRAQRMGFRRQPQGAFGPQIYQPLTQWGNAPVPGTLFFVLVIKWDLGPAMPFVLSLSQ